VAEAAARALERLVPVLHADAAATTATAAAQALARLTVSDRLVPMVARVLRVAAGGAAVAAAAWSASAAADTCAALLRGTAIPLPALIVRAPLP
jgi:hypothetical protein